jgi:hypothetical protein
MSALRRLNNRIDRWLDRRSLRAPLEVVVKLPGGGVPCVVSAALERAVQQAQALGRDACLKQVHAPQGTQPDGAASRWQFHFDLPRARAKLAVDWFLDGDSRAGRFGHETIAVRAQPFPPPDSVLAEGIAEGKVLYGRLGRVWREERRRTPDLPMVFRDSDVAVADLARHGLAVEAASFTLGVAAESGGALVWVARTGTAVYRCPFR